MQMGSSEKDAQRQLSGQLAAVWGQGLTCTTSCSLRCAVLRSSASVASASASVLSVTDAVSCTPACIGASLQGHMQHAQSLNRPALPQHRDECCEIWLRQSLYVTDLSDCSLLSPGPRGVPKTARGGPGMVGVEGRGTCSR